MEKIAGFRIALRASGMTLLLCWPLLSHATETPKIDPAACQAMVNYHEPPGVEYQPGVDTEGHYVAPADLPSNNAVQLPKTINIPLTVSLAKSLNFDTSQYPYNQLGEGTEAQLGVISVTGNKVTLNGKSLSDAQQDKLSALCLKGHN
jgi:hypothetical protein